MFKTTPFKKSKGGSKTIVGSVVEVEGKETDENHNPDTRSSASTSTSASLQKSTISSSVSRIFGASPYKKSSTTRTPGRKLLKKLICTPGKSRSHPDTSLSDIDDFGVFIPNNNSAGISVTRSTSSDETKDTQASNLPSSPPRLARKLLAEEDKNSTMKTPSKAQNFQISNGRNSGKRVDDALVAASNRSGFSEDMIFLTNSSSDDSFDHRNEGENNPMARMNLSSSYSSPQRRQRRSSPSKAGQYAMKSPGMSIPTPAMQRFPQPLRNMEDSPFDERKSSMRTPNPKNLSTQFEEQEDDDAFLPDDFVAQSNESNQGVFTLAEVEQKIREAKRTERINLRKQHERDMEEYQKEFEKAMFENGEQWKKDADEQETRYQKLLKDEKHKTSLKHHELLNQAQSLQDVLDNLKEVEAERDLLNSRVKNLENNDEKMRFSPLKREKEASDLKAAELSEQVRALTDSRDESQNQLERAKKTIDLLTDQLEELAAVDPEELRASKLEVENLKNLRAGEIQALQNQMGQIADEHKDAFTPKKKRMDNGHFESPCVGEIDVLRVDYDKAQEQLKSMGRVLKRYKSERDDLKETIQESEQLHVQAIEIAVKQATEDLKEKIKLLNDENEALRNQPTDIAEKMLEETKNHMEDLKKSHEEEMTQLRATLENQTKNAEEQQKTMIAEFDMESNEVKKRYEKKIESLIQEMRELRSSNNSELSLMQSSSKEEIDSLQIELRQMSAEFEDEKIKLIETTSRERKALEEQIKKMNEMHSEELELVGAESQEEVESLKKMINQLELDLETKSSENSDNDRLLVKIRSLKDEKDAEAKKASKLEAQVLEIQSQNAARIEKVREEYDLKIREIKSEHANESDELLTQLDLIEAEAAQRFKNNEGLLTEKDAVITALGSQLAESESRSAVVSKEHEALKNELESLRSDVEVLTASNEAKQKEIDTLVQRHKKEIEDQKELRDAACNEAREETIALAEDQLAQRQEIYQALKRKLDNEQSKNSVLERDLRFATKELEEMGRRHEAREADVRDELAQCKAALATKEANRIRKEKLHQADLDKAREAEKAMRAKFEESQATSHSIQKTLAALVTDKQRLEQELSEVTAISEELATLCEKNKLM